MMARVFYYTHAAVTGLLVAWLGFKVFPYRVGLAVVVVWALWGLVAALMMPFRFVPDEKAEPAAAPGTCVKSDAEGFWTDLQGEIEADAAREDMTDCDVWVAWRLGQAAWIQAKQIGAQWPHE